MAAPRTPSSSDPPGGRALTIDLPRSDDAPRLAREAVRDADCVDMLSTRRAADLELIISELVTNSVQHGSGQIGVTLRVTSDVLFGEISDEGHTIEERVAEISPVAEPSDEGGYGLLIVAELSRRWGVHEGSSHVGSNSASSPKPPR